MLDTLIVLLKEFFQKNSADDKKACKITSRQRVNPFTALPQATLGVNTASYTPEPWALLVVNTVLFICVLLGR